MEKYIIYIVDNIMMCTVYLDTMRKFMIKPQRLIMYNDFCILPESPEMPMPYGLHIDSCNSCES